jgi:hypothetical protein
VGNPQEQKVVSSTSRSVLAHKAMVSRLHTATIQRSTDQMTDRPTDAFLRGRRARRQGIPDSENPYGSREDLALLWDVGWQDTQTLDEVSQYIDSRSCKVQIELYPDLREELWNLIKSQS